jgi:hypothetical protein
VLQPVEIDEGLHAHAAFADGGDDADRDSGGEHAAVVTRSPTCGLALLGRNSSRGLSELSPASTARSRELSSTTGT